MEKILCAHCSKNITNETKHLDDSETICEECHNVISKEFSNGKGADDDE